MRECWHEIAGNNMNNFFYNIDNRPTFKEIYLQLQKIRSLNEEMLTESSKVEDSGLYYDTSERLFSF